MTFRERLKGVAIALAILIGCFPVAVTVTLLIAPFWSWFERRSGMEAYGHSGPSEWCYLVAYCLLVCLCTAFWSRANRRTRAPDRNG